MKDNDNADRTPRVVLGRAVPAGATVAYRVGDDGWDGWEIDVLEDPAAVLVPDELVAVLDEPEPRPWPSAPPSARCGRCTRGTTLTSGPCRGLPTSSSSSARALCDMGEGNDE